MSSALRERSTDVVPVVVTYNPDESTLLSSLSALLCQVSTVVVVDNGSSTSPEGWISRLEPKWPGGIRLVPLEHNLGLGGAYNIGITIARKLGAAFVLLMDQDSIPELGMIGKLQSTYADLVECGRQVGAVGPRYRDSETSDLSNFVRVARLGFARIGCDDANNFVRADFLISSGLLISVEALDQVGGMDEKLFIDHVDTEWCFRAQSKGFEVYGVCGAVMRHSLGDRRTRVWWGRWRTLPFHLPFRYYYIFRNSVLLWRRPYMPQGWKRIDRLRILYFLLFYGVLAPNRLANLRMMWRGCNDGWRGVGGSMSKTEQ